MATIQRYPQGHQFFDNETPATPLAGGKLYYYEAGTLTHQATYSDSDGLVANTVNGSNAIVLDAQGRLEEAVYLGEAGPYKELLTDADDVTLDPWPEDDIPAATAEATEGSARAPYSQWVNVDDSDSPITLTADDIGNAYAVDTTNGSVTINLPAVATVGITGGFIFKKPNAANSMIIAPNGSDEIEDNNGNVTVTVGQTALGVFSANTEWRIPFKYAPLVNDLLSTAFINGLDAATSLAATDELLLELAGAGAFRKFTVATLRSALLTSSAVQSTGSGTSVTFGSLPAGLNRITVVLDDVSMSGTDDILIQLGDAGGIETSGYTSAWAAIPTGGGSVVGGTATDGFEITSNSASRVTSGHLLLTRTPGTNIWVASGCFSSAVGTTLIGAGAGRKTLSAELTQVRVRPAASDSFDGGQIHIYYE